MGCKCAKPSPSRQSFRNKKMTVGSAAASVTHQEDRNGKPNSGFSHDLFGEGSHGDCRFVDHTQGTNVVTENRTWPTTPRQVVVGSKPNKIGPDSNSGENNECLLDLGGAQPADLIRETLWHYCDKPLLDDSYNAIKNLSDRDLEVLSECMEFSLDGILAYALQKSEILAILPQPVELSSPDHLLPFLLKKGKVWNKRPSPPSLSEHNQKKRKQDEKCIKEDITTTHNGSDVADGCKGGLVTPGQQSETCVLRNVTRQNSCSGYDYKDEPSRSAHRANPPQPATSPLVELKQPDVSHEAILLCANGRRPADELMLHVDNQTEGFIKEKGQDFRSPCSRRLAYFNSKYDIKSTISELSSPSLVSALTCMATADGFLANSGDMILQESSRMSHYCMPPWNELMDLDILNNFWLNEPTLPSDEGASSYQTRLANWPSARGWNSLGDQKWTDPDGRIALSNKQLSKIHDWKRICELTVPSEAPAVEDRKSSESKRDKPKRNAMLVLDDNGQPIPPKAPLQPNVMRDRPRAKAIRQGFVGDCSFLSSLASLAEYEHRMRFPILSSIIYPQEKKIVKSGKQSVTVLQPVINPQGMYACKLHFNGTPRKVLIDDFVPVRKDGKVLSAHTANKRDMWVTLLEKAFIKLMGGTYFMHGSNPGADLFHLTGWIPETIPFRRDIHTGSPDLYSPVVTGGQESRQLSKDSKWEIVWSQLYRGFKHGCCVACLGTSEVVDAAPSGLDYPEGVSVSSGIVARHAYSVIDVREVEGLRLLYIRNPWACVRWKGTYAPGDSNWTPGLEKVCNYDSRAAARSDNGSFWIQWQDVVIWFSHLYLCWNSSALGYTLMAHGRWGAIVHMHQSLLPDDSHCVAYNPQFRLRIKPIILENEEDLCMLENLLLQNGKTTENPTVSSLWVLISRHVRDRKRDLFQKYIACHVFEGSSREKCQATPVQQGIYSNGECSLMRILVKRPVRWLADLDSAEFQHWKQQTDRVLFRDETQMDHFVNTIQPHNGPSGTSEILNSGGDLVIVVSQYSQKGTFNFTLRVHSCIPCALSELPPLTDSENWTHLHYQGEWSDVNSGGCSNHLWSYFTNPVLKLKVPRRCKAMIFLECPGELSVNLRVFNGPHASARALRTGKALNSGPYRAACCCLEAELLGGDHTIIPSTFRSNERGLFQVVCHLNIPRAEAEEIVIQGERVLMLTTEQVRRGSNEFTLLPNGALWNNNNQHVELPLFPRISLFPVPYPYLEQWSSLKVLQPDFRVYESSLTQPAAFHAYYRIRLTKPILNIAVQLKVLSDLPTSILPSLTLFYKIAPTSSILQRNHSRQSLLSLFNLEPVNLERFQRDGKVISSGWGSTWTPEKSGLCGIFKRSDIEGGLSDNGSSPSTAAEQLYSRRKLCTISSTTLYHSGTDEGWFYLDVSSVPKDFVFENDSKLLGQPTGPVGSQVDWPHVWACSTGCTFEMKIITDEDIDVELLGGRASEVTLLR